MTHDDHQAHLDAEDTILIRLTAWCVGLAVAIVAVLVAL